MGMAGDIGLLEKVTREFLVRTVADPFWMEHEMKLARRIWVARGLRKVAERRRSHKSIFTQKLERK